MTKINPNLLFRLMNIWLAFVAVLFISSYLPHWPHISSHVWINEAIYFLLFLLAIAVLIKDVYNRDIFINLSLFLLMHSLSFLNIFIGDRCLLGNIYTSWYVFSYKRLCFCFLFNFFIIYTVIKYLFSNQKTWILYTITIAILLPVLLINFYPYLRHSGLTFEPVQAYMSDFHSRMFQTQILSLLFICLYSYLLYKKDEIIGEYVNLFMGCIFVFLVMDMIDNLSVVYEFQIFSISQYVITINLIFLAIILFKKLCFLCSDYGQFYEDLIRREVSMGKIQVKRHRSEMNVLLLQILKLYFYQRRNYILVLILMTSIGLSYFKFPKFITINLVAFLCCFLILFWFINALYKRRARQEYIIPLKGTNR